MQSTYKGSLNEVTIQLEYNASCIINYLIKKKQGQVGVSSF